MQLVINPCGLVQAIYDETLDLSVLGALQIHRASHVEPDEHGLWFVDLAPVAGPKLGPFRRRSTALLAEKVWLDSNRPVAQP